MNNTIISNAEQAIVDIEFSNMDAHKKANAKAVLHAIVQLCTKCENTCCDTCKFQLRIESYQGKVT